MKRIMSFSDQSFSDFGSDSSLYGTNNINDNSSHASILKHRLCCITVFLLIFGVLVIIIGVIHLMVSINTEEGILVKLGILFNVIGLIFLIGSFKCHLKYKQLKRLEEFNNETPFYIRVEF